MKSILLISALFALSFAAKLIVPNTTKLIPNSFVVVLNSTVGIAGRTLHLSSIGVKPVHLYSIEGAFLGYSAELSAETLKYVLSDPNVMYVEQDQVMQLAQEVVQENAPWHLDRICRESVNDMDGDYYYRASAGSGVTAYIIDTGIRCTHVEFKTNRCTFGYDATNEGLFDGNGHGTHVASLVAGVVSGVAKKTTVVAVKVLTAGGSGTTAGVVAGVNWATNTYLAGGKKPSVSNMSLGGGKSQALDDSVIASVGKGLSYAIAAGNENQNACNVSPANVKVAVTVGSTTLEDSASSSIDERSSFSNFGTCVDVFAPGSLIPGAWMTSDTAMKTISGTSMASPVVAGVMSLVLGDNPTITPAQLHEIIKNEATKGVIDLLCGTNAICHQSPNLLVYSRTVAQ